MTSSVSLWNLYNLTLNLICGRCGAHTINLAAKHFLAAIAPSCQSRKALHDHPTGPLTDSESKDEAVEVSEDSMDTPYDLPDSESPSYVLGKCLAFVTQVGHSTYFLFSLTV